MSTATRNLKKNLDDTRESAKRSAGSAAESISEAATSVRDAAAERVSDARDTLSETSDRLADTLRRAADRANVHAIKDGVVAAVSSGFAATAGALRERSVADIARDVQESARRNPGLFIAGAAVLGFAFARLLSASSERRQ